MNERTPVSAYRLLSSPCDKSIVFVSSCGSPCIILFGTPSMLTYKGDSTKRVKRIFLLCKSHVLFVEILANWNIIFVLYALQE